MICLQMEKTKTVKTLPDDFKVTTLETSLLSYNKRLQVKESQYLYQPTVEPLPQYPIGLVL